MQELQSERLHFDQLLDLAQSGSDWAVGEILIDGCHRLGDKSALEISILQTYFLQIRRADCHLILEHRACLSTVSTVAMQNRRYRNFTN